MSFGFENVRVVQCGHDDSLVVKELLRRLFDLDDDWRAWFIVIVG